MRIAERCPGMLNISVLMGRLTADPELRHTPNGVAVTSFTLAVDRPYAKSGAERQTDFIDVVAWRATAEFIGKYFCKGQMMAVQGAIQTRTYTDKDGNKRKAFEIVADKVSFADSKREGRQQAAAPPDISWTEGPAEPAQAFTTGDPVREYEEIPMEIPMGDDDLPF